VGGKGIGEGEVAGKSGGNQERYQKHNTRREKIRENLNFRIRTDKNKETEPNGD